MKKKLEFFTEFRVYPQVVLAVIIKDVRAKLFQSIEFFKIFTAGR